MRTNATQLMYFSKVLSLRQKHTQQQKIVNKLIQFLVALVQPRMGGTMKRRYPTVGNQVKRYWSYLALLVE